MLVAGVDPGTALTGYGFVSTNGQGKPVVHAYGCIKTPSTDALPQRLVTIYEEFSRLVDEHHPDVIALERVFFNANVKTAMSVGHASGIIMLVAAQRGIELVSYTPLEVKMAVAGYGRAEKRQIQDMVRAILGLQQRPSPDDVADALAIALCHLSTAPFRSRVENATQSTQRRSE